MSQSRAARRRALLAAQIEAPHVVALLKLADPARHDGALLAVRATEWLSEIAACLEAAPGASKPRRRPVRRKQVAPAAPTGGRGWPELNDALDDLWAAG